MKLSSEELAEREALRDISKDSGKGKFKVTRKYVKTKESERLNKKLKELNKNNEEE